MGLLTHSSLLFKPAAQHPSVVRLGEKVDAKPQNSKDGFNGRHWLLCALCNVGEAVCSTDKLSGWRESTGAVQNSIEQYVVTEQQVITA